MVKWDKFVSKEMLWEEPTEQTDLRWRWKCVGGSGSGRACGGVWMEPITITPSIVYGDGS